MGQSTVLIRAFIFIGYVVATTILQKRLQRRPPKPSGEYIHPFTRNLQLLLALSVPLFMPLIAYLWIGFTRLNPVAIVILAILAPVGLFIPWMRRMKVPDHPFFLLFMVLLTGFMVLPLLYQVVLIENGAGLDFTLLPLLFFLLAPPAFMLGLLYHWAPRVLPLDPTKLSQTEYQQATQLLLGFLSTGPRPSMVVVKGKLNTRIRGNPFVGTGPGLLITGPEHAVVLYQGPRANKVVGPGVYFTQASEIPRYVMDLQGHFRSIKGISAHTRDNLEVLVPCSSVFKIQGSEPPDNPQALTPWKYDSEAALRIYLAAEVNPQRKASPLEAHEIHPWTEMPLQEAIHHLQHLIKRYSLDELYAITEPRPGELPRLAIARALKQRLTERMAVIGITVVTCGVGNRITPADPQVVAQRIENWKAHKLHLLENMRGKIKAEYVREQNRARSEVLRELLEIVLEQFKKFQEAGLETRRGFIALQLLETLDAIARQANVQASLPPPTKELLATLQHRAAED